MSTTVKSDKAPIRVLIVDDEPATRSGLSRLLASEGYSVESAESGTAAMELVTAHPRTSSSPT